MSEINGHPPLTDWYPGGVLPERVGVYQRKPYPGISRGPHFSLWDGAKWCKAAFTVDDAVSSCATYAPSAEQRIEWRGLSAPAKEA